jgi:hypothetical protein
MERFKSKKFIMALLTCVVAIVKVFVPDFPEDAFWTIVGVLMGYIFVQGTVDTAKAIKKPAESENTKVGGSD